MAGNAKWVGLRLDPLDTLFFRDGRPFDAATRASGGLPVPQTLAGAIRTALLARTGFDFAQFARNRKSESLEAALASADTRVTSASFRGPWLALAGDGGLTPLLTMPEILKRAKGNKGWSRASPVAGLPGWHDPDRLLPLWRHVEADPKAELELLTLSGLRAFLDGDNPSEDQCVKPADVFGYDHRVGIAVNADTFTAADGMLYAISLLSLKPRHRVSETCVNEACLYAEVQLDDELARLLNNTPVPFGGEGKYVHVTTVQACLPTVTATTGRALWYLATPTFFPAKGRPLPTGIPLKAAASAAGMPISGWDVARNGPRATRFAVPAGAVYFVDGSCEPTAFLNLDKKSDALRQEGWGFVIPGKWEG